MSLPTSSSVHSLRELFESRAASPETGSAPPQRRSLPAGDETGVAAPTATSATRRLAAELEHRMAGLGTPGPGVPGAGPGGGPWGGHRPSAPGALTGLGLGPGTAPARSHGGSAPATPRRDPRGLPAVPGGALSPAADNPFENPFDNPFSDAERSPASPAATLPAPPQSPPLPRLPAPPIPQPSPAFLSGSAGSLANSSSNSADDMLGKPAAAPPLPSRPPLPPRTSTTSALGEVALGAGSPPLGRAQSMPVPPHPAYGGSVSPRTPGRLSLTHLSGGSSPTVEPPASSPHAAVVLEASHVPGASAALGIVSGPPAATLPVLPVVNTASGFFGSVVVPDMSRSNRRPPVFEGGAVDVAHRGAGKPMAACRARLVTAQSNQGRFWSLVTGDAQRAVTFGSEARVTSVQFAPSRYADAEGLRAWFGFERGELAAVDAETAEIVEHNSRAHTSAVQFLLRQGMTVWSVDDNGTVLIWSELPAAASGNAFVSLTGRPRFLRVSPRPVACCVAPGDQLWLSYGRMIEVYAPSDGGGNALVKKVDLASMAGPATCFAVDPAHGLVYSGHDDGRVLTWDARIKQRRGSVVSLPQRVSSLAVALDRYLWVGFTSGRLFVLDTLGSGDAGGSSLDLDAASQAPSWTVSKHWDAHPGASIISLAVDTIALAVGGRLGVVSFADNGVARVWDGFLARDWEDAELAKQAPEYCQYHPLRIAIGSWNIDASKPADLDDGSAVDHAFLSRWLGAPGAAAPDVVVFGLQEIVNLESTTVNARSLLLKTSSKTANKLNPETRAQLWQDRLVRLMRDAFPSPQGLVNGQFRVLESRHMVGLFSIVFVRHDLYGASVQAGLSTASGAAAGHAAAQPQIREVAVSIIKTGLGGLHGNKGAIATRLVVDDTSFCFVNCHLAAHQNQVQARNNDVAAILRDAHFPLPPGRSSELAFVNGGDGTQILDHENVFWFGDLNYRIDLPRDDVLLLVRQRAYDSLMDHDQLRKQLAANSSFLLRGFREAPTAFDPTFKYDTSPPFEYDTSEKRRVPAWCDRILWRGNVEQHVYARHEVTVSDHRPVSASFTALAKSIGATARESVRRDVQRRRALYLESRIRRAKIEWLVDTCRPLGSSRALDDSGVETMRARCEQVLVEAGHDLRAARNLLSSG